jgi:two-component system, OmpR family, sensor histidine kinase VicK
MQKSLNVLIIEDSESDAALLVRQLQRDGYTLSYVRVEDEAALLAAIGRQDWDLIISDYSLPHFNAKAALALIAKSEIDIPCIVVSGSVGEETAVEVMRAGAQDLVLKHNLQRLAPAIARELEAAQARRERGVADARFKAEQQERRRESEERQRIFETSLDLIIVVDRQGRLLRVSPSAADILGYEPREMIGRTAAEFVVAEDLDHSRVEMRRARHGHLIRNLATRYVHKDGHIVTLVWSGVWSEPEQRHFFIGRDMTREKRVERMKDEFIATVSHELRTPVTSIAAPLALLVSGAGGELPSAAKRLLGMALRNSKRLVNLLNDILDIDRIESGQMLFSFNKVDLKPLVECAIMANRELAEDFRVAIRLDSAVEAMVYTDADRLLQVLINLLSNAVKFSAADKEAVVSVVERGDFIRITVRDHGPGIPDEFKDLIFQKFAQIDATDSRRKGGTGLGLSIVKQTMIRLGGNVGFDKVPSGGSVFYIDVPSWTSANAGGTADGDAGLSDFGPGFGDVGAGDARSALVEVDGPAL